MELQEKIQERAVLVGLNADCFTKEQTATEETLEELEALLGIFGVRLETSNCEIDDQAIKDLISKRNQARAAKNFALSDQIRDELKAQGIILEDTPQGTRYRKE